MGSGIAMPAGRNAGVVPGTQPPRPPRQRAERIGRRLNREDRAEARESGLAVVDRPLLRARRSRFVGRKQHVMHHRARRGLQLDRLHPLVFGEAGRQHEIAVDVGTVRGHRRTRRPFPAPGPACRAASRRRRRAAAALSTASPRGIPSCDPLLISAICVRREPPLVAIGHPAGLRLPGRHEARSAPSDATSRAAPPHVVVAHQRQRRDLPGPVARTCSCCK